MGRAERNGSVHASVPQVILEIHVRPRPLPALRPRRRTRARPRAQGHRRRVPHGTQSDAGAQAGAAAGHGVRPGLRQPGGPGRRPGQEWRPRRRPCRAGLRLHRSRDHHAAAAVRQSEAAHVPPARAPCGDQPAGLQQPRRGRTRAQCRARPLRRRARHQHRPQQGHAQRARCRRLPPLPRARLCARQLRHRQHLLAQHPGPARPAGRGNPAPLHRHPARAPGTAGRAAPPAQADAAQDRAGPGRGRDGRDRRGRARGRRRWPGLHQHHDRSRRRGRASPWRRGRRPVRRALVRAIHRGAGRHVRAAPRRGAAGGRRRDPGRRRRRGQVRRRGAPGPVLHRHGLCRPRAGRGLRRRPATPACRRRSTAAR